MGYTDVSEKRFYDLEWRRQRRTEWVRQQKKCADCGLVTQKLFVYWNGVGGKPKSIWSMSDFRRPKVLAQCSAVCASCANKRRWANVEMQHGTLNAYKHHGCRCEPCRTENARRVQQQRIAHPRSRRRVASAGQQTSGYPAGITARSNEPQPSEQNSASRRCSEGAEPSLPDSHSSSPERSV